MNVYKDLKKSSKTSEQAKKFPSANKSPFHRFAAQTENNGVLQEKSAVFDNGMNNETASGFDTNIACERFGSWTSEQCDAHAYTRGSKKDPHTVQAMRGSAVTPSEIKADRTNENTALKDKPSVGEADMSHRGGAVHHITPKRTAFAVIQREKLTDKVTDVNPAIPVLNPNPKPTIVFETMSRTSDNAQSIFNQTLNYSGNTICVVGLNQEVSDFNANSRKEMNEKSFEIKDNIISGNYGNKPMHFLKCFKFIWKRPSKVPPNAQYKMPFVEARLEVMKQAKNLTQGLHDESVEGSGDHSHSFIYRWIDGDARYDNSNDLPIDTLRRMENGELMILSGSYRWESGVDGAKHPAYAGFIEEINRCEILARRAYFYCRGSIEGQSNIEPSLPAFLPRGNINGYYLPETTLMFNEMAHDIVIGNVSAELSKNKVDPGQKPDGKGDPKPKPGGKGDPKPKPGGKNDPKPKPDGKGDPRPKPGEKYNPVFPDGAEQTKESMRMLELAGIPTGGGSVRHSTILRVTKPLKNEFNTENGSTPCYLGEDFLKALTADKQMSLEEFVQCLRQMRQSVFDMFQIPGHEDFQNTLERLETELYNYYCVKREVIRDDLMAILAEQNKAPIGGNNAKKRALREVEQQRKRERKNNKRGK